MRYSLGMLRRDELHLFFGHSVLVVAAHPDDEAIGCGGLIALLSAQGVEVNVLFVADGESSRFNGEMIEGVASKISKRKSACSAAREILGYNRSFFLDLPDNRLDSQPLIEISQQVEKLISSLNCSFILTHSNSDLNVDHRACLNASLIAARPVPGQTVRGVASFEIPSSTGWAFSNNLGFAPNLFVGIEAGIDSKRAALSAYGTEIPPFPHARSLEAMDSLATLRGTSVGVSAAEAFELQRLSL